MCARRAPGARSIRGALRTFWDGGGLRAEGGGGVGGENKCAAREQEAPSSWNDLMMMSWWLFFYIGTAHAYMHVPLYPSYLRAGLCQR